MKHMKFLFAALTVLISLFFVSCSLFSPERGSFYGGKILDNEAMEELQKEFEESGSTNLSGESTVENSTEGNSFESTASISAETENQELSNAETATGEKNETVFWSKSGSVWHLYSDCGYLKNSNEIFSGTVSEAISNGAEKVCSSCENKAGN